MILSNAMGCYVMLRYVHQPTVKQGFEPILKKRLGNKNIRMTYTENSSKTIENIPVPSDDQKKFSLTNDEILTLARQAVIIEDHYSELKGSWSPMDTEW